MSQSELPQVVRSYVSELQRALVGVPREVAQEIVDGVTEELAGLDAAAASIRIEELGDPSFIAAEAKANTESEALVTQGAQTTGDSSRLAETVADPRWYIVIASLLVALGGIVIPVLGWIAGIVMVWMTDTWRTWEKWLASLAPMGIAAVAMLIVLGSSAITSPSGTSAWVQTANPLIPAMFDTWWFGILLLVPLNLVSGLWLLARARRRK